MPDRVLFRVGSVCAIVGATLGFVFNLLHPRDSDALDNTEQQLQLIVDEDIWLFDHVMLLVAVILSFLGLVAIYRSIKGDTGLAWARLGVATAVAGAGVAVITIGIDGIAMNEIADTWATSSDPASVLAAAEVVEEVGISLFTVLILAFFGVVPLFFGLAVANSDVYPKWLGWVAVLAGVLGLVTGFVQAFDGLSTFTTLVLFPIASVLFTLWILYVGVLLWRKTVPPTLGP